MSETQTRVEGPTPAGGAYAIAYWQDDAGEPTDQAHAVRAEIVEFDAKGKTLRFTTGVIRPMAEFDPDQPRDENGRWTDAGGGGAAASAGGQPAGPHFPEPGKATTLEELRAGVSPEVMDLARATGLLAADQATYEHIQAQAADVLARREGAGARMVARDELQHFFGQANAWNRDVPRDDVLEMMGLPDFQFEHAGDPPTGTQAGLEEPTNQEDFVAHLSQAAQLRLMADAVGMDMVTIRNMGGGNRPGGYDALSEEQRAAYDWLHDTPHSAMTVDQAVACFKVLDLPNEDGDHFQLTRPLDSSGTSYTYMGDKDSIAEAFGNTTMSSMDTVLDAATAYAQQTVDRFGGVKPGMWASMRAKDGGILQARVGLSYESGLRAGAADAGISHDEYEGQLRTAADLVADEAQLSLYNPTGQDNLVRAFSIRGSSNWQDYEPGQRQSTGWPPASTRAVRAEVSDAAVDLRGIGEASDAIRSDTAPIGWVAENFGQPLASLARNTNMSMDNVMSIARASRPVEMFMQQARDGKLLFTAGPIGFRTFVTAEQLPDDLRQSIDAYAARGMRATTEEAQAVVARFAYSDTGHVPVVRDIFEVPTIVTIDDTDAVVDGLGANARWADVNDLADNVDTAVSMLSSKGWEEPKVGDIANVYIADSYTDQMAREWHVSYEEAGERLRDAANVGLTEMQLNGTQRLDQSQNRLALVMDTATAISSWATDIGSIPMVAVRLCSPEENQQATARYVDSWDTSHHTDFKGEVLEAYEVIPSAQVASTYQAILESRDNEATNLYHGTDYEAAMSIAHGGFRVGEEKTGRWLGDGVYLADCSSKSTQYVSDRWSHDAGEGALLECRVAQGDTESYGKPEDARYNSGADSVWVRPGKGSTFINAEVCVRDPRAILVTRLLRVSRTRSK